MTITAEKLQAIADAIAMWRTDEYIYISFFALYVYYVLTTIDEEVSVFSRQRWNCGKSLFVVIRYGMCVYIALQLSRNYRNYYTISPKTCKVLMIAYDAAHRVSAIACDVALGLCLSALLQVGRLCLVPLAILCAGPSTIAFAFALVSEVQYPAEPVGGLDVELGYPCYVPSTEAWATTTPLGMGRDIRRYFSFGATAVLLVLAVATLVVRYKGHRGSLVHVVRRDGVLYYIALAALRFGYAILNTPAVMSIGRMGSNPVYLLINITNIVIIPILAQRLLLNLRQVGYMGSCAIASKLLFSPPPASLLDDDDENDAAAATETLSESSGSQRGSVGTELCPALEPRWAPQDV